VKAEAWIFYGLTIFFGLVTPIYWFMSEDPTGTVALILTFFLVLMIGAYLGLVARRIEPRPEDKKEGEIAEGAGELGFFSPQSKWPLFCGLTFVLVVTAPVFGWWLLFLGFGFGAWALMGLVFEYYRGDHAH
jgi:Cytochrome c oxidase subunit IV